MTMYGHGSDTARRLLASEGPLRPVHSRNLPAVFAAHRNRYLAGGVAGAATGGGGGGGVTGIAAPR